MSGIIRSRRRGAGASRRGRSSGRGAAAAALAVLGGLWAPAAGAEVLLFSTNPDIVSYAAPTIIDLNGPATGGTQLTFATTQANQRVVITFNAFCGIDVRSPTEPLEPAGVGVVRVEILVDPAGSVGEFSAPPTAGGRYFCFGRNDQVNGMSATVVASARPSVAGTHKVRVRVSSSPMTISFEAIAVVGQLSLTVTR